MNPLQPTSRPPAPASQRTLNRRPPARQSARRFFARAASIGAALLFLLLGLLPGATSAAPPVAELPNGCAELIGNGSFEQINQVWFFPPSLNPPVYDNSTQFTGNYSLLLGNVGQANVASSSRAEQTIALPANASSIILSFRYYGRTDDEVALGANDRQYLDIFDANTNQFIVRQFEARNKDRLWLGAQYSLTAYRGRTVRLSFGVDNDGQNARLAMNLDEVSLYYCTSTPTATATPSPFPTWTPTFLPTFVPPTFMPPTFVPPTGSPPPTYYPPVTPFPPDFGCTNILVNGDFESDAGWIFGPNAIPGQYVWTFRQAGNRAAQLGNPPNYRRDELSFSSMRQLVTIPANSPVVQLRWFELLGTEETQSNMIGIGEDRQDVVLLNPDLSTIAVLRRTRTTTNAFVQQVVDLSQYRGRSVYIYFNAFNDGNNRRTWMFIDSALLCVDLQGVPFAGQQGSGYVQPAGYGAAPAPVGAGGQTTVIQSGLGNGNENQGAQPLPDYSQQATPIPSAPLVANPAPAGQEPAVGPVAIVTLPPGPEVQPGEATPDANSLINPAGAAPAIVEMSDVDNDGLLEVVAPESTPSDSSTTRRTTMTIAGLCLVLLVVGGLSIGILRVISRPRDPTP